MSSNSEDVSDRHLGHLLLEHMKKHPDAVCQIDAATGGEETNASVLNRSIRLAICIRNYGLQPGDVLCLGGRNHLDLHIPFYAALFNGLPISAVDPAFKYDEIKTLFEIARPSIAFCQKEDYEVYTEVVKDIGLRTKIVTFDGDENSMEKFIKTYDTTESNIDFRLAKFNLDKIYAYIISTSGTTGKQKLVAVKHAVLVSKFNQYVARSAKTNELKKFALNVSPVNWISGYFNAVGPLLIGYTKLQTSKSDGIQPIVDMINKYKPLIVTMSPAIMASLLKHREDVDLTCFRMVTITGAKIYQDVISEFRKLLHKDAVLWEAYGMTEVLGACLMRNPMGPPGSCGRPIPSFTLKLVDPDTGKEVTEPNVPGELWLKGEMMFSGFYNDHKETARTFTEDGFYKTGDILYRDEKDNFFFVDRLKALIKFRNYHIHPSEIEDIVRTHPAVAEVCVCGLPDPHDGERPTACVVLRKGYEASRVISEEIKDLVASKLSKNKQLTGGVLFMDKLPMTSTKKIARTKLLDLALEITKKGE